MLKIILEIYVTWPENDEATSSSLGQKPKSLALFLMNRTEHYLITVLMNALDPFQGSPNKQVCIVLPCKN